MTPPGRRGAGRCGLAATCVTSDAAVILALWHPRSLHSVPVAHRGGSSDGAPKADAFWPWVPHGQNGSTALGPGPARLGVCVAIRASVTYRMSRTEIRGTPFTARNARPEGGRAHERHQATVGEADSRGVRGSSRRCRARTQIRAARSPRAKRAAGGVGGHTRDTRQSSAKPTAGGVGGRPADAGHVLRSEPPVHRARSARPGVWAGTRETPGNRRRSRQRGVWGVVPPMPGTYSDQSRPFTAREARGRGCGRARERHQATVGEADSRGVWGVVPPQ